MIIQTVQQYLYERKTWLRLLDYLQEENIDYKNRIADILKDDTGNNLLDLIESFLSKFIMEDFAIAILRHDVNASNKLLIEEKYNTDDKNTSADIKETQNKLRNEMQIIENRFNKLKFEFNKYLSEHLDDVSI